MKRAVLIVMAVLSAAVSSSAQSRKETKLYEKCLAASSVEAYDLFIRKYPESVYRHTIDSLRFDALYVSHVGNKEALDIMYTLEPSLQSGNSQMDSFKAAAFRDGGRDFIVGVSVRNDGVPFDSLVFYFSEKIRGVWQMPLSRNFPKTFSLEGMALSVLTGDEDVIELNGEKWLHYSYRNYSRDGEKQDQVESLLPLSAYIIDNQQPASMDMMFSGSRLDGRRIEGLMPDVDSAAVNRGGAEAFLYDRLKSNSSLVQIAEADLLADRAVEWWLENNPSAQSTAKSLKFGLLPENCSIVSSFKANGEKVSGAGWSVALFDIRGYTVVCARNSSGNYVLVWCEPRFKDRSSDRILNTVYFEKGSTLALFYYQGRRAFKYKVNLSSKGITR